MSRIAHVIRGATLAGVVLSVPALVPAWAQEPPKPQPDKALVYFVRAGRLLGSARSIFLFADKSFLGVLHNETYGFAYVEPGRHLFWTTFTKATRELELVPGETYYMEVWNEISDLDQSQGEALIKKVQDLVVPDEDDREKAAKYVAKKYGRAVEKEGEKEKAPEPESDVPSQVPSPEEQGEKLKIPAYTKGLLEFMESVTSEFTPTGSPVQFRLVDDVVVDGNVVVHAGTMVNGLVRESSQAGGYGKAGTMEISVAALRTETGALVPLVAQLVGSGTGEKDDAAAAAGILGGLLGGFLVHGRETFYLAGERLRVWTRQDAWIPRTPPGRPDAPAPAPALPADASAASVTAYCPATVHFKPKKGSKPSDVKFVLVTEDRPTEVAVTRVADFTLPAPLATTGLVHHADGWHCTFDGWGLVRYLRVGHETDPEPVVLSGRFDDGRDFTASVPVLYEVER